MSVDPGGHKRGGFARSAFVAVLCLCTLVFAGLGIWQIERRSWKLDLIARVEARIHAAQVGKQHIGLVPILKRQIPFHPPVVGLRKSGHLERNAVKLKMLSARNRLGRR